MFLVGSCYHFLLHIYKLYAFLCIKMKVPCSSFVSWFSIHSCMTEICWIHAFLIYWVITSINLTIKLLMCKGTYKFHYLKTGDNCCHGCHFLLVNSIFLGRVSSSLWGLVKCKSFEYRVMTYAHERCVLRPCY